MAEADKRCLSVCLSVLLPGPGASNNPCSDTYYGPKAFSEKVTKNAVDFLHQRRFSGYMDVHAYSQLWMIPWGSTTTQTKDHAELVSRALAASCHTTPVKL